MKACEFIDGYWKLVKNSSVVSGLIFFKMNGPHEKHQTTLDSIEILGLLKMEQFTICNLL